MNNDTFAIGEIAVIKNVVGHFSFFNGTDCEIVGGCEERSTVYVNGTKELQVGYLVRLHTGTVMNVGEHRLRKKFPTKTAEQEERNQVVAWGDCAWQPKR